MAAQWRGSPRQFKPTEVSLHRVCLFPVHVALDVAVERAGGRALAPVVEDTGQVQDTPRPFGDAEKEFVVLHAIVV